MGSVTLSTTQRFKANCYCARSYQLLARPVQSQPGRRRSKGIIVSVLLSLEVLKILRVNIHNASEQADKVYKRHSHQSYSKKVADPKAIVKPGHARMRITIALVPASCETRYRQLSAGFAGREEGFTTSDSPGVLSLTHWRSLLLCRVAG